MNHVLQGLKESKCYDYLEYDHLSLGQFVVGFINNVLETQHFDTVKHMLTELGETVKLADNLLWSIARGAFVTLMHKIEEEAITWADRRVLAYSQSAVFSGSVTMSSKPPGSPRVAGGVPAHTDKITWTLRGPHFSNMCACTVIKSLKETMYIQN